MSLGFFFEASSLSHSLSNFSDRLSAESEEEIWYMSDNSKRCLYPFFKIGLVQHPAEPSPQVGDTVAAALQVQTRAREDRRSHRQEQQSVPAGPAARRGQLPRAICLLPFPEILAAFVLRLQGACSKGERKSVPPVIKRQPQRAGRFRDSGSCVHLRASFASQREEPSLLVSGLGECQVWFLRRRTYYRWRQFL